MESIIKSFLGVFFILLVSSLGISLMSASIFSREVNSFASDSEYRIENSHFSNSVIEELKSEAEKRNCTLTVEKNVSDGDGRTYGRMTLEYPYEIKILGINTTKKIERDLV